MQAFYVKKEKKLSNVYHKINAGNRSNFHENVKDNEMKSFLSKVSNLFFQVIPDKTINLKRIHQVDRIFFLQNA